MFPLGKQYHYVGATEQLPQPEKCMPRLFNTQNCHSRDQQYLMSTTATIKCQVNAQAIVRTKHKE